MNKRLVARTGITDIRCGVKFSNDKTCSGTAFVPVPLSELVKIRVFGPKYVGVVEFSCRHMHEVTLVS